VREEVARVRAKSCIVVAGVSVLTDRSGSGDVDISREGELVEDRAREAGLNVEDELLEQLLGSHGVEEVLHLGTVEVAATREAHGTLTAVIVEEDKNVIVRGRLEGLAATDASHVFTREDLDEVLAVNKRASEILRNAGIHIRASGLVDDLTALGVLSIVGDIILHHDDDMVLRDTHVVDNLISVADISLVTIVVVTITTSSKDYPSVGRELLLGKTSKRISKCNSGKSEKSKQSRIHFSTV